jgi:hypothetical protein
MGKPNTISGKIFAILPSCYPCLIAGVNPRSARFRRELQTIRGARGIKVTKGKCRMCNQEGRDIWTVLPVD